MAQTNFYLVHALESERGQLIDSLFHDHAICPYSSRFDFPAAEVLNLAFHWLHQLKFSFDVEEPWIPVGMVGPIIVWGHYLPGYEKGSLLPKTPMPEWASARVLVTEDFYVKALKSVRDAQITWTPTGYVPPAEVLPATLPTLSSYVDTFNFLARYFYFTPNDLAFLSKTKTADNYGILSHQMDHPDDLSTDVPIGLAEAARFLFRKQPIVDVRDMSMSMETVGIIPQALALEYSAICYFETEKFYYILSPDIPNYALEDKLAQRLTDSKAVVHILASEGELIKLYSDFRYAAQVDLPVQARLVGSNNVADAVVDLTIDPVEMSRLQPRADIRSCSVVELFNWVLHKATVSRASDLHFEPLFGRGRVRMRMDGDLQEVLPDVPGDIFNELLGRIRAIANLNQNTFIVDDARFSFRLDQTVIDVRVSAVPMGYEGQKVVMRLLDKGRGFRVLSSLDMTPNHLDLFQRVLGRSQGLFLVTGPTGSGKSTTLYACLAFLNKTDVNIQTVEDPIEYQLEGINQTSINVERGLGYKDVLPGLVRQDPDIMLVGEIRDIDTAKLAVEAAMTGHLVLSTLHSLSTLRSIHRLLTLGVDTALLGEALIGVQAQRLVKRLCPRCRRRHNLTEKEKAHLIRHHIKQVPEFIYVKKGCSDCYGTGYKGQFAVMEMCIIDEQFQDVISGGASPTELRKLFESHNYRSLYQEALVRVVTGVTSLEAIAPLGTVSDLRDL